MRAERQPWELHVDLPYERSDSGIWGVIGQLGQQTLEAQGAPSGCIGNADEQALPLLTHEPQPHPLELRLFGVPDGKPRQFFVRRIALGL